MFIPPMLASPPPKPGKKIAHLFPNIKKDPTCYFKTLFKPNTWAAEEKYDGHRIGINIKKGATNLFSTDRQITAYSRYGNVRVLPTHILEKLNKLPECYLDGELMVPGSRSYGVTELTNSAELVYFVFDLIDFEDSPLMPNLRYDVRKQLLEHLISKDGPVRLAPYRLVDTWEEVISFRDEVWSRDGEGLILKYLNSPYESGKRSKNFIKIKDKRPGVATIIGFEASRGLINNRGDYGMVILRDDEGVIFSMKTLNDKECRKFEERASPVGGIHPDIGRRLCYEYQELTPEDKPRHPRWDRWENE